MDGIVARASLKLRAGSLVSFIVPQPPRAGPAAEEIDLDFLYCDDAMAAVNKPPGMVVHPAKGNWQGTLAGALMWHLERRNERKDDADSVEADPSVVQALWCWKTIFREAKRASILIEEILLLEAEPRVPADGAPRARLIATLLTPNGIVEIS